MESMKTVAAIHDLSCYAKSSLTVVIPALSIMGVEVSPLPTALLSTQTDGFSGYHYRDLTDDLNAVLSHWKTLDLSFDAIYSGFLGSERSIQFVLEMIRWQSSRKALVLIDPVMGDNGEFYGPLSDVLVEGMRQLIREADVITPNLTEAAILLGRPYQADLSKEHAVLWARELSQLGPKKVAITSVVDGNSTYVASYDAASGEQRIHGQDHLPVSYPGCGDLFASILTGNLLRGKDFFSSVGTSALLVKQAIEVSHADQVSVSHGISVERIASLLAGGL